MTRFSNPLDHVSVAATCPADWDQMSGNDRVRFCGKCNLNVYNLSALSKSEAESFIASNEGRLCVRFYRRTDGSILTRNCPIGLQAIRRRVSGIAKAVCSSVLSFMAGIGVHSLAESVFSEPKLIKSEPIMGAVALMPLPVSNQSVEVEQGTYLRRK
jgi:hypothetical protein